MNLNFKRSYSNIHMIFMRAKVFKSLHFLGCLLAGVNNCDKQMQLKLLY